MKTAGLDWEVRLEQMYRYKQTTRGYAKVPDSHVVVRVDEDRSMGAVKSRYVPFQNTQAFAFGDLLVDEGIAKWWSAGELYGGTQVFAVMRFTADFKLVNDLETELFLLLRSSHNGSKAIQAIVTPIEAQCTNQSAMILGTAPMRWAVPHVSTAEAKLAAAQETLRGMSTYAQALRTTSEKLAAIDLELHEFESLLHNTLPNRPKVEDTIEGIMRVNSESPTVTDELRRTAWGAFEAVTEYFDHVRPTQTSQSRFTSIYDGAGARARNAVAERLLARAA